MTAAQSKKNYDLSDVLIDEKALAKRIAELGAQITGDYEGKSIVLVGILKGSIPFIADLMRHIRLDDLEVDYISVSS